MNIVPCPKCYAFFNPETSDGACGSKFFTIEDIVVSHNRMKRAIAAFASADWPRGHKFHLELLAAGEEAPDYPEPTKESL